MAAKTHETHRVVQRKPSKCDETTATDDAVYRDPRAGFPAPAESHDASLDRRRLREVPIEDLLAEVARRGITAAKLLDMMSLVPVKR